MRSKDEKRHNVTLTRGFWMCETETTQRLWRDAGGDEKIEVKDPDRPVVVSWDDCQQFISHLNSNGFAPKGMTFCLPTEAEWEYACRAGSEESGIESLPSTGWYVDNTPGMLLFSTSQKVKGKNPNQWGLYDMHGNLSEWCEDWYGDYSKKKAIDPTGPASGTEKVCRGGGYGSFEWHCRSAVRMCDLPNKEQRSVGFRLVLKEKDRPVLKQGD